MLCAVITKLDLKGQQNMTRELKIEAARAALELVMPGMKLGIGTGSTAEEFVRLLGEAVSNGLDVVGVPTSERTRLLCEELGIHLSTLDELPELDLVIDGADEVDADLNLIKGGGAALLREKIVAHASKSMVVIADETKWVERLGKYPLPIEVNKFGLKATHRAVEAACSKLGLSGEIVLRGGEDTPIETDGGHYILDASLSAIPDVEKLSDALLNIPGVVEHGLFIDYARIVFLSSKDGVKRIG